MENATKALIIAAAVLIAIILISLGVGIIDRTSEQIENADLTEYQIKAFNDKFTQYVSTNCSGAEVNALIDTVVTNNNATGQINFVSITYPDPANASKTTTVAGKKVEKYPAKVTTGSRFKIEVTTMDSKTGLVSAITVTAVK